MEIDGDFGWGFNGDLVEFDGDFGWGFNDDVVEFDGDLMGLNDELMMIYLMGMLIY